MANRTSRYSKGGSILNRSISVETEVPKSTASLSHARTVTPNDRREPHPPLEYETQWIGPVEFVSSTPEEACDFIIGLSKLRIGHHIHLSNAYTVALANGDREYRQTLAYPALNFPDGKPVAWVSSLRRDSPPLSQVRGPQLFLDVFDQGRDHKIKHFLLGSTPEVLEALKMNLSAKFPGIDIAGVESPPFRRMTASEVELQDARIKASGAQIVWVGLGTPKQDVEARRIAGDLPVVAIAIGAAFDFAAGVLRPAPVWMRVVGLEWAYRLVREPRRLWKRYFFGNVQFCLAAISRRRHDVEHS